MSSSFGEAFRITTFGESHGAAIGVVIDGCPSRLPLVVAAIQTQLNRRRPGPGRLTSPRDEPDRVEIVSGVEGGTTLGSPITLVVTNRDARPQDYADWDQIPRPSHADFTYRRKYGITAASGGGRASARETIARVAAGSVAEQLLARDHGVEIVAWVESVADVTAGAIAVDTVNRQKVDRSPVRCPDLAAATSMEEVIVAARADGDSVGGVIACVCRHVPAGWGEPVFAKLEARLAQAMLSIPAVKGFEIGSGFAGSRLRGSQHNDRFVVKNGDLGTATNHSGGVQGGISNGEPIVFRVACKPPASIALPQRTVDYQGQEVDLKVQGRHDPCVLPRAVPIVEGMAALVLADLALRQGMRACSGSASDPGGREKGAD
jgi:chorismate synthase